MLITWYEIKIVTKMVSLRFSGVAQPNDIPPLAVGEGVLRSPNRDFGDTSHIFGASNLILHQFYIDGANFVKIGYICLENDVFVTSLHAILGRNLINL